MPCTATSLTDHGHFQGQVRLPSGAFTVCGAVAIREDDGSDWLDFYIPLGALDRADGSKKAFEFEGIKLRQLAEECPAHIAESPKTHCCAEIGMGRWPRGMPDRRRPYAQLHVEYCYVHR